MGIYTAEVVWFRGNQKFNDKRYSRRHLLRFDGGIEVAGSSSPNVVPPPFSSLEAIDPEEAFVSALSSCHMLWFLSLAAERGFVVDHYHDIAEGVMGEGPSGKMMMLTVALRPKVRFSGTQPREDELRGLHHQAHEECFIANSVITEVRCEPRDIGGCDGQ